jgi:predicted transposase/invertase (TIGR01784 family)
MGELRYKMTNDALFKMVFVNNEILLKRLVAVLLRVRLEEIEAFSIINPEMPPAAMGEKFCRLDINMKVNGQIVDLEIQVNDEYDYPERSLYYWAREYSSALGQGKDFTDLPRTIVISILAFSLFDSKEFHSEFEVLETTRYERLTDRFKMHYFELPKLPEVYEPKDEQKLWLALFNAKTEEDLEKIQSIGGEIMEQAVNAYRRVSGTKEFQELERLRYEAKYNEGAALRAEKINIAKKLKAEGVDVNTIARSTNLTVDDILKYCK